MNEEMGEGQLPVDAPKMPGAIPGETPTTAMPGRRKMLAMGLGAAPVLMALSSRPAWACNAAHVSALTFDSAYRTTVASSFSHQKTTGNVCIPPCSFWNQCWYQQHGSYNLDTNGCSYYGIKDTSGLSKSYKSCVGDKQSGYTGGCGSAAYYSGSQEQVFLAAWMACQNANNPHCGITGWTFTTTDIANMCNGAFKPKGSKTAWTRAEAVAYLQSCMNQSSPQLGQFKYWSM